MFKNFFFFLCWSKVAIERTYSVNGCTPLCWLSGKFTYLDHGPRIASSGAEPQREMETKIFTHPLLELITVVSTKVVQVHKHKCNTFQVLRIEP